MQKGCMLKLMSIVQLLILAPVMDSAPATSEVPDLQQASLKGKVCDYSHVISPCINMIVNMICSCVRKLNYKHIRYIISTIDIVNEFKQDLCLTLASFNHPIILFILFCDNKVNC